MMMTTTNNGTLSHIIGGHNENNPLDYENHHHQHHHHHQLDSTTTNHQIHTFVNDPNDWKYKLASGKLGDEDLINHHIDSPSSSDEESIYSEHRLTMDDDSDDDAFFGGRQRNNQTVVITHGQHDLDSSSSEDDDDNDDADYNDIAEKVSTSAGSAGVVDLRYKSPRKQQRRSFRMGQDEDEDDTFDDLTTPSFQHVNSIRIHHPFYQKYGGEQDDDIHHQPSIIIQQQSIPALSSPSSPLSNDSIINNINNEEESNLTNTIVLSSADNNLPIQKVEEMESQKQLETINEQLGQQPSIDVVESLSVNGDSSQSSQSHHSPIAIIATEQTVVENQPATNQHDNHHFEIVTTTTTIDNNNSTVQYTTTTVPPNLSNPYASVNDNNYALQQALRYNATVIDNSTEYIDDPFTRMESPFANMGPKTSIINPSTRVQPTSKKRVRFADTVTLFPITYITPSPREEKPPSQNTTTIIPIQQQIPPQQQFSIVTTISSPIIPTSTTNNNKTTAAVATIPAVAKTTTTGNIPPTRNETNSSTPPSQQSTQLQKSVSFNISANTPKQDDKKEEDIISSSNQSNGGDEKDDNGNPMDNEDDEFRTNDGKKRLWGLTGYQYLVLASAWLGWAFDIFDGVLFSYAAPICIPNLLGYPDDQITSKAAKEQTALWTSILSTVLLFGWGCGGVFFGWLTDKVGRSKTMMITIIVYSIGTFLAAFSFHISILVILRFVASLGIGGEWSAGAALISETLPIEKRVIGGVLLYTAAPIGSMASFAVNYLITSVLLQTTTSPAINGTITNSTMLIGDGLMSGDINAPVVTGGPIPLWLSWRILFAIGVIPTIVGIFVRLCVKEPDAWLEQKKREKEEEEEENNIGRTEIDSEAMPQTPPRSSNSSIISASPAAFEKSDDSLSLNAEDDLKEIDLNDQPVMSTIRSESEFSSTSATPFKKKRNGSSYLDLFANADLRKRTISAILFVCPALISWWCISTFIPILSTHLASTVEDATERKNIQNQYSVLGNMLFNFGGLIGTLLVIPVAMKLGRLWVYRIYFFFSTFFIIIAFAIPDMSPYVRFCLMFPVGLFVFGAFGSFTFYLPELFPLELRGRGAGFTYNCGRFGTAIFPFLVGILVSQGVNPLIVLACLSIATAAGFIVSIIPKFAVETKNLVIH